MQRPSGRQSHSNDPLIGQIIDDRYHVLQCIGKGGMGAVYLAEHVLIRRKVALKTLHPQIAASADLAERFHREAVAAAAIGNEHIVEVLDMRQLDNGAYYIVLEHLQGIDLAGRVASEGRLSVASSLHIAVQLCDALRAVHGAGIVHRDLKPENLFLIERRGDPEFLKVLDFGICKFHEAQLGPQRHLTATGAALGTPDYMAPEQIEARQDIDPRADLYAVGGVLHFALSGDPPFEAATLHRLFQRICEDPPPRISRLRADVPAALDGVLQRALAKRPEQRFESAAELKEVLLPLLASARQQQREAPSNARARAKLARSGVQHVLVPTTGTARERVPTVPIERTGRSEDTALPAMLPGRRRWPLRAAVVSIAFALGLSAWWQSRSEPEPGPTTDAHENAAKPDDAQRSQPSRTPPTALAAPPSTPEKAVHREVPARDRTRAHRSPVQPDAGLRTFTARPAPDVIGEAEPVTPSPAADAEPTPPPTPSATATPTQAAADRAPPSHTEPAEDPLPGLVEHNLVPVFDR